MIVKDILQLLPQWTVYEVECEQYHSKPVKGKITGKRYKNKECVYQDRKVNKLIADNTDSILIYCE